jgi:Icc-related predicted phosphoesterase
MTLGALGDIHGDFEAARRIMRRHPEVPFWICVGDVADDQGRYEDLDAPLYWIKGNNENFDRIASGNLPSNLHYLPAATPLELSGVTIVGLGGTLAPTWYDTAAAELPHPAKGSAQATEQADKRRHLVREEVERCKALRGIDILLTHEAPRPYIVGAAGRRGIEAGKAPVNEVLASLKPRLHLFGHHHRFTEQDREGVRSVGLDLASRSYLLIDAGSLEYARCGHTFK